MQVTLFCHYFIQLQNKYSTSAIPSTIQKNAYSMSKSMPYCITWLDQAHQREDIQPSEHKG